MMLVIQGVSVGLGFREAKAVFLFDGERVLALVEGDVDQAGALLLLRGDFGLFSSRTWG